MESKTKRKKVKEKERDGSFAAARWRSSGFEVDRGGEGGVQKSQFQDAELRFNLDWSENCLRNVLLF